MHVYICTYIYICIDCSTEKTRQQTTEFVNEFIISRLSDSLVREGGSRSFPIQYFFPKLFPH